MRSARRLLPVLRTSEGGGRGLSAFGGGELVDYTLYRRNADDTEDRAGGADAETPSKPCGY